MIFYWEDLLYKYKRSDSNLENSKCKLKLILTYLKIVHDSIKNICLIVNKNYYRLSYAVQIFNADTFTDINI